jgi:HlyD family secretion protein
MKNKIVIVSIVVIVVLGAFIGKQYLEEDFHYAGTIEVTRIDLSSRVATSIGKYFFSEGDKVNKDSLLVELNCEDIKIANQFAQSNFERSSKLLKSGSIPQGKFDEIKNQMDGLNLKLSWCSVKAPIDGTILTQYKDEDEWAFPGEKLLALANLKEAWAYIYIEQSLISKISLGMKIEGIIPELGDKIFNGRIIKINNEAEFTPKNVQTRKERSRLVFGVKILFENDDETLKPGMSIEVKLPEQVLN